jgi:hypothetical protein
MKRTVLKKRILLLFIKAFIHQTNQGKQKRKQLITQSWLFIPKALICYALAGLLTCFPSGGLPKQIVQ